MGVPWKVIWGKCSELKTVRGANIKMNSRISQVIRIIHNFRDTSRKFLSLSSLQKSTEFLCCLQEEHLPKDLTLQSTVIKGTTWCKTKVRYLKFYLGNAFMDSGKVSEIRNDYYMSRINYFISKHKIYLEKCYHLTIVSWYDIILGKLLVRAHWL